MSNARLFQKLSDWEFFEIKDGVVRLSDNYVRYQPAQSSFSDYAWKLRIVSKHALRAVKWEVGKALFPEGSVLAKTFYYPVYGGDKELEGSSIRVEKRIQPMENQNPSIDLSSFRLIETRVLEFRNGEWIPYLYQWNDDQSDATLIILGDLISMSLYEEKYSTAFDYYLPEILECSECHGGYNSGRVIEPLGWQYWQIHQKHNQHLGVDIEARQEEFSLSRLARQYLAANCAYCHNPVGKARNTGLFLDLAVSDPALLGVCKQPVAAGSATLGMQYDIFPGKSQKSILTARMMSTLPEIMMPELGRSIVDREAVEKINDWIDRLDGQCP